MGPETLLRWQRDLVRRRWAAFGGRRGPGRPTLPTELRELIGRLAREDPGWGYQRIRGELLKLGRDISATAIRSVLRRRGIPPAHVGSACPGERSDPAQAAGVLACDFLTVETVRLTTLTCAVLHRAPHAAGLLGRLHRASDK